VSYHPGSAAPAPRSRAPRAGLLGEIHCAPGQAPHRLHIHLVDTQARLHRLIADWHGEPPSPDVQACCCLEPATSAPFLGWLVFSRQHLTLRHVVHEVTHAAAAFVLEHVRESETCRAMPAEELDDYLDEALATTVETLFAQSVAHLFPGITGL